MRTFFYAVLLIALVPLTAAAAPMSPVVALEQLRKGFAGMQDFTAEITQEKQLAVMKRKLVSTGTVRFKKPDLFFMELVPPHASRMVLRDSSLDLYFPKEKSRQQIALPADEGLKRWLGLLAKPVTALPEAVDAKADLTGDTQTLTISPRKKGQVHSFTLTSGSDGRLRKLVIDERNGNRTAITFQKMRANVGLSEKDFKVLE
ncbi:outer membrane lipoprotein carrier protein LolA [Geobacter pelophilus]|uniref:Outer membrane lipoprotein carrier protein LolA n=1 Tax=Geoanaerobacter pelophilus TaxID=60036 RepID=A0AAW4L5M5_9BACT|nr:outer membrane lipoprotein carrier protein LolA [Geoanaerobacter pelophilus]MBT0663339.1 outer membrane lipoprotein carrier protein LolA [Geoanaerobacter pelophilus]